MDSNLVPTVRADKNGKLVTRHVKNSVDAPTRTFKAPVLPARPDHNQMVKEIVDLMEVKTNGLDMKPENVPALYDLMKKHELPYVIDKLHFYAHRQDHERFIANIEVIDRHIDATQKVLDLHPECRDRSVSLITGILNYDFPITPDREMPLIEAVCNIWASDALDSDDLLDALFPSSYVVGRNQRGIGDLCLTDGIAELIVNNPGKESVITELVLSRKISDPEVIRRLVEGSESASLISGVL